MKPKGPAFFALIGLLAIGAPLFAHHGDAAYSAAPMEMKGCVVTDYSWINPHSLVKFDYKTAKGEVEHWTMEIGSPPSMVLLGWSRTTLKPGDRIVVAGSPARREPQHMYVQRLNRPADGFGFEQVGNRPRLRKSAR